MGAPKVGKSIEIYLMFRSVGKSVSTFLRYFITIFGLAIHPPYLYDGKGYLGSSAVCYKHKSLVNLTSEKTRTD